MAKRERLRSRDPRARRSEGLGRSAARAGARQGKEAARRRRRHADRRSTSGLNDARELFELARGRRRRRDARSRCAATSPTLEKIVADLEFRRMFNNPMDPRRASSTSRPAAAAPRRRTGRRCCERMYLRYCERRATSRGARGIAGRSRRHQERVDQGRPATTLTAICAPRPACTGWCARARSTPTRGATRRSPACSSIPKSTTRSRSRSTPPTCASIPFARRAPAASTSTRPTPRSASRTCRRASSCSARTTARSTATAPRRWRC